MEVIDQRSVVLPGSNERIAEQRLLHQPNRKWSNQLSQEPWGQPSVHDDESATRTKLFPNLTKNRAMMRHDVIGKAEKHAIKQFLTCVISGIGFNQHEVSPLAALAQFPCPARSSPRSGMWDRQEFSLSPRGCRTRRPHLWCRSVQRDVAAPSKL